MGDILLFALSLVDTGALIFILVFFIITLSGIQHSHLLKTLSSLLFLVMINVLIVYSTFLYIELGIQILKLLF